MWWWMFVLAFMALVVYVNARKSYRSETALAERYPGWLIYKSRVDESFLGVDVTSLRIALGTRSAPKDYILEQITSFELIENGLSITKTNRTSQVVGVTVGALLLGPLGAVIGGLSGSSRTDTNIRSLSLKIVVDDVAEPVQHVTFLKAPSEKGYRATDPQVIAAKKDIERFHAHLTNAFRSAGRL